MHSHFKCRAIALLIVLSSIATAATTFPTSESEALQRKTPAGATQYDLINGTVNWTSGQTATWKTGSSGVFNVGSTLTVNGAFGGTPTGGTLDVSALTLTIPATVTGGTSSFQPRDTDLDSLAAASDTGIHVRTGAGTSVRRAVTGTANQITVTNGDGVSGAPTISIPTNPTLPGNVTVSGTGTFGQTVTASTFIANSAVAAPAAGTGQIGASASLGLSLIGSGSSIDIALFNKNGSTVMSVPTGTVNASFNGNLTASGTGTHTFGTTNTVTMAAGVLTTTGNVRLPSGAGYYLDGGGDTYISENTANRVQIVAGGAEAIGATSALTTVSGNLTVSGATVSLPNNATITAGGGSGPLTMISTADASSLVLKAGSTGGFVSSITIAGGTSASNPGSITLDGSQNGSVRIKGSPTNDNAATAYVGEYLSSTITSASPVSLTTGTVANITSLSLTAGDWHVWGDVGFTPGGSTTVTYIAGGVGTTSATLTADQYFATPLQSVVPSIGPIAATPIARVSVTGTTTVYLVAQSGFAVSTMAAFGKIQARRIR
jgi:hypothetical protein